MSSKCPFDNINDCLVWWAWEALWDKTKPYYLPNTILNGLTQSGKVVVDKMGDIIIADTGNVPFSYGSQNITAEFKNNMIKGFDTIANDGFNYDYKSTNFSAVVGFSNLSVTGQYSAQLASGVKGCALNTVKAVTGGSFSSAAVGDDDSDADVDLADNYRDGLLDHPMGRVFVTSYYQNNETFATLFQNGNVQTTWNEHQTGNENSQYYMEHISTALQPENRDTVPVTMAPNGSAAEGQPSYLDLHGLYMSIYLSTLSGRYGDHFNGQGDVETAQQYWKSASDTIAFRGASETYTGKGTAVQTGSTVLANIQGADADAIDQAQAQLTQPASSFSSNPTTAIFAAMNGDDPDSYGAVRAAAMAEAEAVDIVAALERNAFEPMGADDFSIHGGYTITIPSDFSVTLSGTLIFGSTVIANITSVTAQNPQITLNLEPKDGLIFNALEKSKEGAIASLLSAQIVQKLNSDQIRSYLTDRMNEALAQKFGSVQSS